MTALTELTELRQRVDRLEARLALVLAGAQPVQPAVRPSAYDELMRRTQAQRGCMWDAIPLADRMKPMGLSCPCPRCTGYSSGVVDCQPAGVWT